MWNLVQLPTFVRHGVVTLMKIPVVGVGFVTLCILSLYPAVLFEIWRMRPRMNDGGRRWNGWTDAVIGVVIVVEVIGVIVIVEVVEETEDALVGKRGRVVVGKEEAEEAQVGVEVGLDQGRGAGIGRAVLERFRRMMEFIGGAAEMYSGEIYSTVDNSFH
jgi:hypothetical protein